jgi:hypothetical protein
MPALEDSSLHIKEGQVREITDVINVAGPDAFLAIAEPLTGWMRLTEQIGHKRMHSSGCEEHSGIALRDQGTA